MKTLKDLQTQIQDADSFKNIFLVYHIDCEQLFPSTLKDLINEISRLGLKLDSPINYYIDPYKDLIVVLE